MLARGDGAIVKSSPSKEGRVIELDASLGEGGGQVLRYSLALASITGREIRLFNIRRRRERPGLQRQHLAALKLLAEMTDAQVEGDELGSTEVVFRPSGGVRGGSYFVDVGSAGSISLVLQAALPVMAFADSPVELRLRGGTDVPKSPTYDYLSGVLLEHLRHMSYNVRLELIRRGHYPRGGGEVRARSPGRTQLDPLRAEARGRLLRVEGRSHATNLPRHVAERQASAALSELRDLGDLPARVDVEVSEGLGPGSGIAVWVVTEFSVLGSDSLGERGRPAEDVGRSAARILKEDLSTGAALDRHASDMLLPYMMFAEGVSVVTGSSLTSHAMTVVELARRIAPGVRVDLQGDPGRPFRLTVEGRPPSRARRILIRGRGRLIKGGGPVRRVPSSALGPVRDVWDHVSRLREAGMLDYAGRVRLGELPSIIASSGQRAGIADVEGYQVPFAFNLMSSEAHAAVALGVEAGELRRRLLEAMDSPRPPASVSDLGMRGPLEPNLEALPIPKYYEGDAGRYLTSSVVFARDRDGRANASIHRIRVLDGRRGVIRMVEGRHLHRMFVEAASMNEDLRVVVEVGANPLVELASAYQAPYGLYEAWIANSLAAGELGFAEVGGLEVPKGSAVLLEGRIRRDVQDLDLMVDVLGMYDKPRMQPVVEFERMYLSERPLMRGLLAGGPEHRFLMSYPVEVKLERHLRDVVPGVRRVVLTEGGGRWLHAVVQLEKRLESDPRAAIVAAFTYDQSLKMVIVVDEDVDPSNPVEVEFALATRVQPDRDIIVIPGLRGSSLDPSSDQATLTTAKWGIDATAPLGERERFRRALVSRG